VTKHARISAAEIVRAKTEAEKAGLRLTGLEKRPDGTIKFEFAEFAHTSDIVVGKWAS